MLDMGFIPDIKRILKELPKRRQTAFFSATLGPQVVSLAGNMLVDPMRITINPEQPTVEKIRQQVLFVNREDKCELLISMLSEPEVERVIVFTRMKHMANRVSDRLKRAGIKAAPIHGNRTQSARIKALNDLKQGRVKVLVATDIAARGIDVDGISHVVNFDIPNEPETYVHRIGRTARAGAYGQAWSFCSAEERGEFNGIERLLKKQVPLNLDHEFHSDRALNAGRYPARGGNEGKRRFKETRGKGQRQGRRVNARRRRARATA